MSCMINPNTWPNPPIQIIDAEVDQLPEWHPDWDMSPPWVHAVIRAWAHGLVPAVSGWTHLEESWRYEIAFDLDGVEWMWRDDGDGVWTLVTITGLFDAPY
jgi:hypothetical protein